MEVVLDVGWSLYFSPLICSTFPWCNLLRWHFYLQQTNTHTSRSTKRGEKAGILPSVFGVFGVFGRAGGDRQAGEGSTRFDPLHFSLHVYIDVIYFLMLTQQTEQRKLEAVINNTTCHTAFPTHTLSCETAAGSQVGTDRNIWRMEMFVLCGNVLHYLCWESCEEKNPLYNTESTSFFFKINKTCLHISARKKILYSLHHHPTFATQTVVLWIFLLLFQPTGVSTDFKHYFSTC